MKVTISPEKLADRCFDICVDRKALGLRMYDVRQTSLLADYYLICSGTSVPHIRAIADHLARDLGETGIRPRAVEGSAASQWIVLDFGTVLVHIFHPDMRRYYAIEDLWNHSALVKEGTSDLE